MDETIYINECEIRWNDVKKYNSKWKDAYLSFFKELAQKCSNSLLFQYSLIIFTRLLNSNAHVCKEAL